MDATKPVVPLMRSRGHGQAPPSQIKRVLHALRTQEAGITAAEKKLAKDSSTWNKAGVKLAIQKRDYTRARLDAMLAYAQEHTTTRNSSLAKASLPFLAHIAKCKEDIYLVTEAAAGHSGSNAAFEKLAKKYEWLLMTWTKQGRTELEPDDAFNRALTGLLDAALRYDPTRCGTDGRYAAFATVAYRWIHRNTRARTKADRPGTESSLEQVEECDQTQNRSEDYSEGFPHQFKLRRFTLLRAKPYTALAAEDRVRVSPKLTDDILSLDEVKELYKEAIA